MEPDENCPDGLYEHRPSNPNGKWCPYRNARCIKGKSMASLALPVQSTGGVAANIKLEGDDDDAR